MANALTALGGITLLNPPPKSNNGNIVLNDPSHQRATTANTTTNEQQQTTTTNNNNTPTVMTWSPDEVGTCCDSLRTKSIRRTLKLVEPHVSTPTRPPLWRARPIAFTAWMALDSGGRRYLLHGCCRRCWNCTTSTQVLSERQILLSHRTGVERQFELLSNKNLQVRPRLRVAQSHRHALAVAVNAAQGHAGRVGTSASKPT